VREFFWRLQRHTRFGDDVSCLKVLLTKILVTQVQVIGLIRELRTSTVLGDALNSPEVRGWLFPGEPGDDPDERLRFRLTGAGRVRALSLYVIARVQPPTTVVETGCATGWDSALILLALEPANLAKRLRPTAEPPI
jgi:hypothetical protein